MTFTRSVLRSFALAITLGAIGASGASAQTDGGISLTPAAPTTPTSTTPSTSAQPIVSGTVAKLLPDGTAAAPALAPDAVQEAIWAGNKLIGKPYRYGGGHARFNDTAYDCSGSVSYALHGGDLVDTPMDSTDFMSWGDAGAGQWVTVYANAGHAFTVIAGLRLDTSATGDPSGDKGPRWRPVLRSTKGFKARHPDGY